MIRLLQKLLANPVTRSEWIRRISPPFMVLLILLGSFLVQDSVIFASLRGESRFEDDLRQGSGRGYYENLIGANETKAGQTQTTATTPGIIPFRDAGIVENVPTYVRWRMRPHLDIRWNETTFRTNSLGFRTPEVAVPKPDGTYRIVCFGSSNTMGHGVEEAETYPRRLERWLRERVGSLKNIEVVNLAVSGDSPTRRLQRMHEEGQRFQADWFLCEASPLDYLLEEEHLQMVIQQKIPVPWDFVSSALERVGATSWDSKESFHRKLKGEAEGLLEGAYRGWRSEAGYLLVPISVVMLPRSDRKVESPRMYRMMRTFAERYGLDYFDLSNTFRELDENQMQVSRWDNHPSVLGHTRIFEDLRDRLEQRGGLPNLPFAKSSSQ